MILKGDSYEEIVKALINHYPLEEIDFYYEMHSQRQDNLLIKRVTIRLDSETYNLIKESPSKLIREAILSHFARGNRLNRDCPSKKGYMETPSRIY
jgi:hypothetical protein